ncbi:hypothetical protein J6590_084726 [Homalodisca vitripennis]|nr:hypothetical protein J6590_084726 [Homalodisca vitripennis]
MVFWPPLPAAIDDLKQEMTTAIQTVTPDMLLRVWNEFEYRVFSSVWRRSVMKPHHKVVSNTELVHNSRTAESQH